LAFCILEAETLGVSALEQVEEGQGKSIPLLLDFEKDIEFGK
jgi:hypothetical protein